MTRQVAADRVAMVTGASRGIGKAIAVDLARAGYDVAVMARTVREGTAQEYSPTVRRSDTRVLPGSLESTARLVEEAGRRALMVPLDLLDPSSCTAAVRTVVDTWGHVDVLVNNARYVGPGHLDLFLDTPLDLIRTQVEANLLASLQILREVLPSMLARGGGTVIDVTSMAATMPPPAPAGSGGWGLGYAVSKGAFHRVAPVLAAELGDRGIRAYNLDPGFVATERNVIAMADHGVDSSAGAPPELIGRVVTDLLHRLDAGEEGTVPANGATIHAQPEADAGERQ
jgi:NAD(P)-dependent dehydrogenase (short-subunit alcohol dehydrogenase family)